MKKAQIMSKFFIASLFFICASFASAQDALEIAKKNDKCDASKITVYSARMVLKNKNGAERVREFTSKTKKFGDVEKSVFVFSKPKDVEGSAFLSFSYEAKADGTKQDDDSWLYMPALKKVRRISGSGKDEDFMGSDFTFDDLGSRGIYKDDFTLLGQEDVDGVSCFKLEAKSTAVSKYPRHIYWIRKDNYFTQKSETYDKKDALKRVMTIKKAEVIDGFYTQTSFYMEDVQTGHSTLIEMSSVSHSAPVDDNIFTTSALERGIVR